MIPLLPLLAAVALSASSAGLTFDPANLDVQTLRSLAERGAVVIVDNDAAGKLKLVTAGIVVDAPPQAVFDTAMDYEHYTEFMPQVEKCKVTAAAPDHKDVDLTIKIHFSLFSTSVKYQERVTWNAPQSIDVLFNGGDLKTGGGSWRMVPLDGGKRTLAFYSTMSDLRSTSMITRQLLKDQPSMESAIQASTTSMVVGAVKKRTEAVAATQAAR